MKPMNMKSISAKVMGQNASQSAQDARPDTLYHRSSSPLNNRDKQRRNSPKNISSKKSTAERSMPSSGIESFQAADMRQALKKVRDSLGADAVILANHSGPEGVEILAALEASPEALAAVEAFEQSKQFASQNPADGGHEFTREQVRTADAGKPVDQTFSDLLNQYRQQPAAAQGYTQEDELLASMRSEIQHLRNLLQEQVTHMGQDVWSMQHPILSGVARRLEEAGLQHELVQQIVRSLPAPHTVEDGWRAATDHLTQELIIADQEPMAQTGVVVFLGPTGAGKTTTLAKLAVRHALKEGAGDLALITTDDSRIAAYEQLCTIGRIIDVPVRRVDSEQSMAAVLDSLSHKKLIMVDMAGLPTQEHMLPDLFGEGLTGDPSPHLEAIDRFAMPVSYQLVLPATSQRCALEAALNTVNNVSISGCIITKLDEAPQVGEVLSLVVENHLPLTYITQGQAIPNDLERASAELLIARLNASQQTYTNSFQPELTGLNGLATPTTSANAYSAYKDRADRNTSARHSRNDNNFTPWPLRQKSRQSERPIHADKPSIPLQ